VQSRKAARLQREFDEFTIRTGWHRSLDRLPASLTAVAKSRRSQLLMWTQREGYTIWLSWHRWQESTGSDNMNNSRTRDLTQYFVELPRRYPDASVLPRIGGFLNPVRGIGTGDADFDRAFVIKPTDNMAAISLVTPQIRAAMRDRRIPPWQIAGDLLILADYRPPSVATLNATVDVAVHTARLLPA
jgi:hypothetical protein